MDLELKFFETFMHPDESVEMLLFLEDNLRSHTLASQEAINYIEDETGAEK